jgi:hypothetical protein
VFGLFGLRQGGLCHVAPEQKRSVGACAPDVVSLGTRNDDPRDVPGARDLPERKNLHVGHPHELGSVPFFLAWPSMALLSALWVRLCQIGLGSMRVVKMPWRLIYFRRLRAFRSNNLQQAHVKTVFRYG